MNVQAKIRKLIYALNIKGYIYLENREQFYSNNLGKACTIYKLIFMEPVEDYNKKHPEDFKDPDKYDYVKIFLFKTYKEHEILVKLAGIYREVGERNNEKDN